MTRFYIFISALFLFACGQKDHQNTAAQKVAGPLNSPDSSVHPIKVILVSSAKTAIARPVMYRKCEFDIVVDSHKDTTYTETKDTHFRTTEGYHVGMKFSELPQALIKNINKEVGWGYYMTADSGWQLGFCEGSSCTDHFPADTSRVKWIFRRK